MRKILYYIIILLTATVVLAQNRTTVTAIVRDSNGTVYQNCSYSVDWVNQSTLSVLPSFGGGNFQTSYSGARCDSSGNLSIQLPSNTVITPQPNKWRFDICSVAGLSGGPYCFQTTLTISGATQDISAALTSVAALLPPIGAGGGSLNGLVNRIVKFGTLTSGVNSSLSDDTTTVSTPENFSIGGTLNVTGTSTLGTVGTGNSTAQSLVAATGGANQSSPLLGVSGNYWNGAASAADLYTWQNVLGTGTNPSAILTLAHTGSTGLSGIQFPVLGMGLGAGSVPGGGSALVATSGPSVISQLDLEAPTVTENTNPYHNLALGLNVKPSANSAQNYSLQKLVVQVDPTNTSTINDATNFVKGNVIDVFGGGSGATNLRGIDLYVNQQGTSTGSTAGNRFETQPAAGAVGLTSNAGLELLTGGAGTWTGTTTNDYGLLIDSPGTPAGSTLTNHYGIYLADQTVGGAVNPNPFAIFVAGGRSQFQGVLESVTPGTVNFTASAHTSPIKSGTTAARPATCTFTAGVAMETYLETDATAGQNLDFCTATNTWTRMSGGGGNPVWSTIQNPAANQTLNMAHFTTTWTGDASLTNPMLTLTDSAGDTYTSNLFKVTVPATSTAAGIGVTVPVGGVALNLDAGDNTGYIIKTPLNHGVSMFNQLESSSTGHALTGSLRFNQTDPAKYRDATRTGGAVDSIMFQGVLYSGNPGAPFPFAAGTGFQVGDVEPVMLAGPLTSLTPGANMTLQPYPQIAGNTNGGTLNLNGGKNFGTGIPGNVAIGGTAGGAANFNLPITFPYTNSPTNATVVNDLVCYDPANPGTVMACAAGSPAGVQGVCLQNCGVSGSALVVVAGPVQLNLDNLGASGDYICPSTSTLGFGTDCGTNPSSGQTVANVQSSAFVSGTLYNVQVNPGSPNPSSVLGNALVVNPASTAANTTQATGSTVTSLSVKAPTGAASGLCAFQVLNNAGAVNLCDQQGGVLQIGTGVTGSVTATQFIGPNVLPATTGLVAGSDTDLLVAWRNHANSANLGFSKDINDRVNLNTNFGVSTSTITAGAYNGIGQAPVQTGVDACAKINTALLTYGIAYGFGFAATENCASNPFAGVTSNCEVWLGATTFSITSSSVQWIVPKQCKLHGLGKRISTIKWATATADPASNTPIVCMGICTTWDSTARFDIQIYDIGIDCNNHPHLIGLQNISAQEGSTAHHMLINNCTIMGLDVHGSGAQHGGPYGPGMEFYHPTNDCTTATMNIALNGAIQVDGLYGVTASAAGCTSFTPAVSIDISSDAVDAGSLHCEGVTVCTEIGDLATANGLRLDNVSGLANVTTVVHRSSAFSSTGRLSNIRKNGAANIIVDQKRGLTLTTGSGSTGNYPKYELAGDITIGGSPIVLGNMSFTTQGGNDLTADLAPVTVYTTAANEAGSYRICFNAWTSVNGSGTTSTVVMTWQDDFPGTTKTFTSGTWALNATNLTSQVNGCQIAHVGANKTITIGTASGAGVYGTSHYSIEATVEHTQ